MATNFINFSTKHAVAASSRLKATKAGHIYDILVTDDELDNGAIVKKGDFVSGQVYNQAPASEEYRAKVLSKAANGNYYLEVLVTNGDLLVIQTPIIYEDYTTQCGHVSNFFNVKGDKVRSYELYVGDIYELSAEGFTAKPEIGDEVKVDTTTGLLVKVTV